MDLFVHYVVNKILSTQWPSCRESVQTVQPTKIRTAAAEHSILRYQHSPQC